MHKLVASLGAIAAVVTATAAPVAASAQPYGYDHRVEARRGYYNRSYSRCRHERRSSGNKGTVAGALVGGASGALIGGDVLGGLVGAGVGAVAGHEIAKRRVHC